MPTRRTALKTLLAGAAAMPARQQEAGIPIELALYQPERPHNFGAVLRLCACFGVELDVVEPCGFPLDDRRIRQAALDYAGHARWRHCRQVGPGHGQQALV